MGVDVAALRECTDGYGSVRSDPVRRRRFMLAGVALLAALLLSLRDPALAAAATLYVDEPGDFVITNDLAPLGPIPSAGDTVTFSPSGGSQVSQANLTFGVNAFGTIQDAVTAAAPNDTINVADGTFVESVTVSQTMTLRGNQAGVDARTRTSGTETIIENSATGVSLAAAGIVVDGFTFRGLNVGGGSESALFTDPLAAGYQIRNSIFQGNIVGLRLQTTGAVTSVVERNLFLDNDEAGSLVSSVGLLAGPTVGNLAVRQNRFMGNNSEAAILIVGPGVPVPNVGITDNTFEDGNQVETQSLASSTISGNTFSGALPTPANTQPAVSLNGTIDGVTISGNTFTDRASRAISAQGPGGATGPNPALTITNNTITQRSSLLAHSDGSDLIFFLGVPGTSSVTGNTVTITRDGGILSWVSAITIADNGTGTVVVSGNTLAGGQPGATVNVGNDPSTGVGEFTAAPFVMVVQITDNDIDGFVNGVVVGAPGPSSENVTVANNRITRSASTGILVRGGSTGALITGNTISGSGPSTAGLGIDLEPLGVTPNDPADADIGPNGRQNFPVIAAAETRGGTTFVIGTLNSTPSSPFRIEVFANQACDASGSSEGEEYLGAVNVTTDGSGDASFVYQPSSALAAGRVVTATATNTATRSTSEFSACRQVETAGVSIAPSAGLTTTEAGGVTLFGVKLDSTPSAPVTIAFASSRPDEGTVSPSSLTFTPENARQTQLVTVTGVDDTQPDGDVAYTIITAPATSTDPAYAGLDVADIAVTNQDNDVAPVPPVIACTPRPNVGIRPVADGSALQVTVSATPLNTRENNALLELRFGDPAQGVGDPQNARITLNGQAHTERFSYAVPPGVHEVTFTVQRVTAGQPTMVPLLVVDRCGEWKTFVGGGAAAGF